MRKFHEYVKETNLSLQKSRIAGFMARHGIEPYSFIEQFFNSRPISESWMASFFDRLGNAWDGFWKENPDKQSPMARLEAAKTALNDLHTMVAQNVGTDPQNMQIVLNGLEQSLALVNKIEPTLKELGDGIANYQQTGIPHSSEQDGLPEEWHDKWADIMTRQNQAMHEPDGEGKKDKLLAIDDELSQFWHSLQDYYQKLNPHDPATADQKKRIKKYLDSIHNDSNFRNIRSILDDARQRSASGVAAQRPDGHEQVTQAWAQIAQQQVPEAQKSQMLVSWYQKLPDDNPVKAFVRKDMQDNPSVGTDEIKVFWKYAVEWINKYPHHLGA